MSYRKKPRAPASHDRWLVSYADFITLLFAFFVVLYAAAEIDKKKAGRVAASIQSAFQQMGAFPPSAPPGAPPTAPPDQPPAVNSAPPPPPLSPLESQDLSALRQELEQALAPEISRGEVAVRIGPEGLVVSLREVGFFDSGSAGIKAHSQPAFSRMAILLSQHRFRIRIEGHTDNVPIHNSKFNSNWELSTTRATEMVQMLITKYQIPPEQLSAAGYAAYHPLVGNETQEGRAKNRRVDVVILGNPKPQSSNDPPLSAPGKP